MNELIKDYQRKINTINELLKDSSNSEDTINRLKIKVGCYRSFLTELNRALNIDLVSHMLTVKEVLDILDDSDHLDDAKTLIRETVS